MKIAFLCDLHLPFDKNALQYDVLRWAIADMRRKCPDAIVFAGDLTCDGNEAVYREGLHALLSVGIPCFYIPGNSDLRCPETRETLKALASPCRSVLGGTVILALNDADGGLADASFAALEEVDAASIVFLHHPIASHEPHTRDRLLAWRETHPDTKLFFGHLHRSFTEGNSISLQALDPDKSIGECPSITYYDTESAEVTKAYYFAPVPTDWYEHLGISCYDPVAQVDFAVQNGLRYLELRPNAIAADPEALAAAVARWRAAGGIQLSVHLPDIGWEEGAVREDASLTALLALVRSLRAQRVTQHVPLVSVGAVRRDPKILEQIAAHLAARLDVIEQDLVIGVENMHMTAKERADDTRRFGYVPEECLAFMEAIGRYTRHRVGINFDIGHARNNAPYSQTYQVGTWLSMLGPHIVGYHIHQVTEEDGRFENHMPITEVYGRLIGYASFFGYWLRDRIAKAPVILEMRPKDAYAITLDTFRPYRDRVAFDLHSHTGYSFCGKDDPHELIETAIHNGISVLGISDHNYGIGRRKAEYKERMRELAEAYRGRIRLLCGIEIATVPEHYDLLSPEEIRDYDYCLIEHITYDESIVRDGLLAFCDRLGIPCGIAHTDLFLYCDRWGYDYATFFREMAARGIFWELNVSYDSIHAYREHAYVRDFMASEEQQRIVREAGLCVSVGFDSHRCAEYDGYRVHAACEFLKKAGIRTADTLF